MSALTSTELMHASLELVKVATKLRRETSHIMTTPAAAGIGTHPTHVSQTTRAHHTGAPQPCSHQRDAQAHRQRNPDVHPAIAYWPFGVNATAVTLAVWPMNVRTQRLAGGTHRTW
mgnify:CR=1 FL=1